MLWLYNFGITLYGMIIYLVSFVNPKAKLFIKGRAGIFKTIENQLDKDKKRVWFHFASLGEFEQGRPVLEELKKNHPEESIVVTFFSPSGYEIRKNYPLADGVFYLPLDTRKNAAELIRLIQPKVVIFTKYEFWYHYFKTLQDQQIPLLLISGIFRPDQIFFKRYGALQRKILSFVSHFFVQNQQSVSLLKGIGIQEVSLSGDTRFDRVAENAQNPKQLPLIAQFCGSSRVFIAGSTWPQDEQLLAGLIAHYPDWKFIIAPHEVDAGHIGQLCKLLPDALKYSVLKERHTLKKLGLQVSEQLLLIDNIGLLSSVYQYADIAYIGGGFGAGIHNTLEAAAFGLPVIFGPKYGKFQEAKDLIELHAAYSIDTLEGLTAAFEKLQSDDSAGNTAKTYVQAKTGSTRQIINYLENGLL